jgi:ADP-ribose pyrophosphatase YjhB (NUDIX family)
MKDFFKNKKLPRVTVDTLVRDRRGRVLLVKRGRPPFLGSWALPGGFCEYGETTEECGARRRDQTMRRKPGGSRRERFDASSSPSITG